MPILPATEDNLQRATALLRSGEIVAFATETVYGLGANALDAQAVQKIFVAKGRPSYNPLIVHVPDSIAARQLTTYWPDTAEILAQHFWPGALTLVLPKRDIVPDVVTAGLSSVALRAPAHPVAQALLQAAQLPLAAPSANRFTQTSPTQAQHVINALGESIVVLEGGACAVGIESTVLDLSGDTPILLRPGIISRQQIEAVIGPIALREYSNQGDKPRPSPGLVERHYAPRAQLIAFDDDAKLHHFIHERLGDGIVAGAMLLSARAEVLHPVLYPVIMPGDAAGYARELYATLHALDELNCDIVFVEEVPEEPQWEGVRDRLRRATHA